MKWNKKGLVYSPRGDGSWKDNSALTPTPILLNSGTIRIFAGFRDPDGISRIGYVDLDAQNPSIVMNVSEKPVLELGKPGTFDDNGMILGDIVKIKNEYYMYYVGFQLIAKAKFYAFTGLAISKDGGNSFNRFSEVPVMDRSDEGRYIRAIHSAHYEDGKIKVWYAAGNGWEKINGNYFPQYFIKSTESLDGKSFPKFGDTCVTFNRDRGEYRIGRPRAFRIGQNTVLNYTYGTIQGDYLAGMALLENGTWKRMDKQLGIELSPEGWDSLHLCYPAIINVGEAIYMFYNGNHMGLDGFGYAELVRSSL